MHSAYQESCLFGDGYDLKHPIYHGEVQGLPPVGLRCFQWAYQLSSEKESLRKHAPQMHQFSHNSNTQIRWKHICGWRDTEILFRPCFPHNIVQNKWVAHHILQIHYIPLVVHLPWEVVQTPRPYESERCFGNMPSVSLYPLCSYINTTFNFVCCSWNRNPKQKRHDSPFGDVANSWEFSRPEFHFEMMNAPKPCLILGPIDKSSATMGFLTDSAGLLEL